MGKKKSAGLDMFVFFCSLLLSLWDMNVDIEPIFFSLLVFDNFGES